jgi:hypothetical protein
VFVAVRPDIDIPVPPKKLKAPVYPLSEVTPVLLTYTVPVVGLTEIPAPLAFTEVTAPEPLPHGDPEPNTVPTALMERHCDEPLAKYERAIEDPEFRVTPPVIFSPLKMPTDEALITVLPLTRYGASPKVLLPSAFTLPPADTSP